MPMQGSPPLAGPGDDDVNTWERHRLGPMETFGRLPASAGEPVVVIQHGAGGQAANYEPVVRRMAERMAALAVNQPGHGMSEALLPATVPEMAENLEQALSALNSPVILVGHSLGGAVAIELALRGRVKPAGIVLYSTGAKLKVSQAIFDGLEKFYHVHNRESLRMGFGSAVTDEILDRYLQLPRHPTNRQIINDFRAADRFDRMDAVAGITRPVLVLGGDSDRLTPPKYQEFLAERIPGARRAVIPGAGHQSHFEAPEAFLAAVLAFVQNVTGKEPVA